MWPGGIDEFAKVFNSLTAVLGGGSSIAGGGSAGAKQAAKKEEKANESVVAPAEAPKAQEVKRPSF